MITDTSSIRVVFMYKVVHVDMESLLGVIFQCADHIVP